MNRTLMTLSFLLLTLITFAKAQTTFSNLDDTSSGYSWQYYTGGADQAWMTQGVTTIQQDGASQEFHFGGSQPYMNAFWWVPLPAQANAATFDLDFHVYHDTNASTVSQALEWGVSQYRSGQHFYMDAQCDFKGGSGLWRFYDPQSGWQSTNRTCAQMSQGWTHFTFHFTRQACPSGFGTGDCGHWTSMDINGVNYPITRPDGSGMYSRPASSSGSDALDVDVQLDGDSADDPYEIYMDEVNLTANGSALPTPPPNAASFLNLQNQSGNPGTWTICSGTSCAGGSNTGSGSHSFNNTSPSLSGASMSQTSNGNSYNVLYYRHLGCPDGNCTTYQNFLVDLWFYPPSATTTHVQAFEFDPDLYLANYAYFASVQCDHASGFWRLYNTNGHGWVTTTYPCSLATDTWHHIQLYVTMDTTAHTYTYQTFYVDGAPIFTNLGTTYSAKSGTYGGNLNIEQQIDNNSTATSTTAYYDQYNFWVW